MIEKQFVDDTKEKATQVAIDRLNSKIDSAVSAVVVELLSSGDAFIASSLGVDVKLAIQERSINIINQFIKED